MNLFVENSPRAHRHRPRSREADSTTPDSGVGHPLADATPVDGRWQDHGRTCLCLRAKGGCEVVLAAGLDVAYRRLSARPPSEDDALKRESAPILVTATSRIVRNDVPRFIEVSGLDKPFGTVRVLRGVDVALPLGRVTALIGDNGVGKSTLVGLLAGLHKPSSGTIAVDGTEVEFTGPRDAMATGIESVFQSLALIPTLDVTENIFLGRERRFPGARGRLGFVDTRDMRRAVRLHRERDGVNVPAYGRPVNSLSGGQRQIVAVLRATFWVAKYVILDEPTASLGVRQRSKVLDCIRSLRDAGIGVLLISHNLEEILSIVDHVIVLRPGRKCVDAPVGSVSHASLVLAMSGVST